MRSSLMRTPAITEIYNHKMTYQNHIKKLDKIREERKNQLQFDHGRVAQIQHLKEGKSKTFANKFNEQNFQINQSNIKFLCKLENVKPFTRYTSYSSYDRPPRIENNTFLKPITKRKIIQTEKENSRIFFKMKSVSSSLSKDKMMDDYAKAQRIKSRITKYTQQNNKIALKSQKYFSQNKSTLSNRSLDSKSVDKNRNNLVSHYRKEDIIRNRVTQTDHKLLKVRKERLPSLAGRESEQLPTYIQQKAFFTTEPLKSKRSLTQRRKY